MDVYVTHDGTCAARPVLHSGTCHQGAACSKKRQFVPFTLNIDVNWHRLTPRTVNVLLEEFIGPMLDRCSRLPGWHCSATLQAWQAYMHVAANPTQLFTSCWSSRSRTSRPSPQRVTREQNSTTTHITQCLNHARQPSTSVSSAEACMLAKEAYIANATGCWYREMHLMCC
jgi:hypothetical protein